MKRIIYVSRFLLLTAVLLSSTAAFAQQTVSGFVKNDKGQPLPGASVSVRGTRNAVAADSVGHFTLTVNEQPPFFLRATFVGYKPQDFQILKLDNGPAQLTLVSDALLEEIVVTSRRRTEAVQDVPIPISVVGGAQIEESGSFNANRLKELVPSVQFYSSNPRNTTLNIRGLGSTFGLTNDGIDPGVGFYVDGVYYARPAAGTFDFIDVERIEVLRGPQGTLFGKNTSSGAFNITTRKPSFSPDASFETSFGNYGYIQAKASVTGPLSKTLAGRFSFSGTQRDGTIRNIRTLKNINDINNLGFRGQLLYRPSDKVSILLAGDNSRQRPDGYAQIVAGVAPTLRPAYRQFNAIIADLGYALPTQNAFDRIVDHDTPWNSGNDLGGVSLNADIQIGPGTLTATTAWRYWKWDPSNDRDFTGLQSLAKSNNYSKHQNWSQEVRYAGDISENLSGVVGLFYIDQEVQTDPVAIEESGSATWRFSQSTTSALWRTPNLFEGFGVRNRFSIKSTSAAVFANVDWEVTEGLHILPGIRFNYDKKDVLYDRKTYGGLQTTDPALLALKALVYQDQYYVADADEKNFTYQLTAAYRPNKHINAFATYSTSFKPIGVNVSGLPTVNGAPALDLAVIRPEDTKHYEVGVKTNPTDHLTLNLTLHNSDIKDYQTNVQSAEIGVNRGYLANAEKVRVRGIEFDGSFRVDKNFSFYGAAAFTEGKYIRFTNAPLPLEETGLTNSANQQVAFKDISGGSLPGISKWAGSLGGEFVTGSKVFNTQSNFFTAVDASFRSDFSSSPSPSRYLNVEGYALVNARIGWKSEKGLSAFVWARNLLDKDYFEQLLPAGGNAGHYAGVLGDPRTFGLTLRYAL
ncbi:TonB-dependent receptor [Pedobacter sp. SYP-B3415]|uniref:TonB-dependent receptor n=1 Tax=Pedobacter sp. SYP-B3415 TaxID=2496641 RepID=UPI00101D84BB|nr:TonB-dependent receptor [Pedobacter sp. SYP-B3415]